MSVAPEDMGSRFLAGAVQHSGPSTRATDSSQASEQPRPSAGEARMLEALVDEFSQQGGLVTTFPSASGQERVVSEICRDAIQRARAMGALTDEQVHRAARDLLLERAEELARGPANVG